MGTIVKAFAAEDAGITEKISSLRFLPWQPSFPNVSNRGMVLFSLSENRIPDEIFGNDTFGEDSITI
jgi:hypothetical protein